MICWITLIQVIKKERPVELMNEIRIELGEDWGQRQSYRRIGNYIPFDEYTKCQLENGERLDSSSKMIKPIHMDNTGIDIK